MCLNRSLAVSSMVDLLFLTFGVLEVNFCQCVRATHRSLQPNTFRKNVLEVTAVLYQHKAGSKHVEPESPALTSPAPGIQ